MITEAIQKAIGTGEVEDWAEFDSNSDGLVDALYVLYAGEGQHALLLRQIGMAAYIIPL